MPLALIELTLDFIMIQEVLLLVASASKSGVVSQELSGFPWLFKHHEEIRNLGLVFIATFGLTLAAWRSHIASKDSKSKNEDVKISQSNSLNSIYTSAVAQLGENIDTDTPNYSVRIGAIYALERLARDNEEYHQEVMNVLCSYVRINSRNRRGSVAENINERSLGNIENMNHMVISYVDVQEALSVLGRRDISLDKNELDLSGCRLYMIQLGEAGWDGVNFSNVQFYNMTIRNCSFEKSKFLGSTFNNCGFYESFFEEAKMAGAQFNNCIISKTSFEKSNLEQVKIQGQGSVLYEVNFENSILNNLNVIDAELTSCKFNNSHFYGALITSSELLSCEFDGAGLDNTKFGGVDMALCTFIKSSMCNLIISEGKLSDLNLKGAMTAGLEGIEKAKLNELVRGFVRGPIKNLKVIPESPVV